MNNFSYLLESSSTIEVLSEIYNWYSHSLSLILCIFLFFWISSLVLFLFLFRRK